MVTGYGLTSIGSKGADITSDGIGPLRRPDESRPFKTNMNFGNSPFDTSIFQKVGSQERIRNFEQSDSDFTEEMYQMPPNPRRVHRENGQDLFGQKSQEGRPQVTPPFGENENERKWQRLRDARASNGEQWRLFN